MAKALDVAIDIINKLVKTAKEHDDLNYYGDFIKVHQLMYLGQCYLLSKYNEKLFEENVYAVLGGVIIGYTSDMDLIPGKCGFDIIDWKLDPETFGTVNMPLSYFRDKTVDFVIDKYGRMSTTALSQLVKSTPAHRQHTHEIDDSNPIKAMITINDMKATGAELFTNDLTTREKIHKLSEEFSNISKRAEQSCIEMQGNFGVSPKMTGRKDITKFLGNLLIQEKFTGALGKYWASEVSLDYGTTHVRRVDFMQFCPVNQIDISGIEKGIFICYEVKSCKADFKSGFGQNFVGEKNYFVMPMSLYKELASELPHGVGVLVPIPKGSDKKQELENPTPLGRDGVEWELATIKKAFQVGRQRSMNELLFCMLRAGH